MWYSIAVATLTFLASLTRGGSAAQLVNITITALRHHTNGFQFDGQLTLSVVESVTSWKVILEFNDEVDNMQCWSGANLGTPSADKKTHYMTNGQWNGKVNAGQVISQTFQAVTPARNPNPTGVAYLEGYGPIKSATTTSAAIDVTSSGELSTSGIVDTNSGGTTTDATAFGGSVTITATSSGPTTSTVTDTQTSLTTQSDKTSDGTTKNTESISQTTVTSEHVTTPVGSRTTTFNETQPASTTANDKDVLAATASTAGNNSSPATTQALTVAPPRIGRIYIKSAGSTRLCGSLIRDGVGTHSGATLLYSAKVESVVECGRLCLNNDDCSKILFYDEDYTNCDICK